MVVSDMLVTLCEEKNSFEGLLQGQLLTVKNKKATRVYKNVLNIPNSLAENWKAPGAP